MKSLKFKKIDAFTKGISSGNPAGYVLLNPGETLSENEMQTVARELKGFVNEVGFVHREENQFYLKFYSSECEVAFCGHATIAIMYDLVSNNSELLNIGDLSIHVNAGMMPVLNRVREEDAVYITAPKPEFLRRDISATEITAVLGTTPAALNPKLSLEVVDGGLRTLIVPMLTLADCLALYPNQEKLRQFCAEKDIDILHVSSEETAFTVNRFRTRVFAPKYGYLEDPATGSGNAAFSYYLIKHGLWREDFAVEQGPSHGNPNTVRLRRLEIDGVDRIQFGGPATIRIQGQYCLHQHD